MYSYGCISGYGPSMDEQGTKMVCLAAEVLCSFPYIQPKVSLPTACIGIQDLTLCMT